MDRIKANRYATLNVIVHCLWLINCVNKMHNKYIVELLYICKDNR